LEFFKHYNLFCKDSNLLEKKQIISQLNLVEDIGIGVEGVESVNIAISLRDLANGGCSARLFNIAPATPLRAGVMTAQQANTLMNQH